MKQWIAGHAYGVTSIVFLALFLIGTFFLGWGRLEYAFGLLLFLIVVLGIRLDDIAKSLLPLHRILGEMEKDLRDIHRRLDELGAAEDRDPDRGTPPPPETGS